MRNERVSPYPAPRDPHIEAHNYLATVHVSMPALDSLIENDEITTDEFDMIMKSVYAAHMIETLTEN